MPAISLGTVYRNLGQLVEHGMINSLEYKGAVRYDGMIENHHHFACNTCGKIYDIFLNTDQFKQKVINQVEHVIQNINIEMTGTCKNCKN